MVKSGAGGACRNAKDLGDLGRLEPGEVTQHENCALLGIQSTETALQLIPVGHGQVLVRTGRKIGWEHAKVGDDATLAHRFTNTGSDDETVQPRVEPFRIAESGQITPGDHQRVLYGILGSVDIAEDPLRDREEPITARANQVGVCLPIPAPCRLDEIAIHGPRPLFDAQRGRRPITYGTSPVSCVQSTRRTPLYTGPRPPDRARRSRRSMPPVDVTLQLDLAIRMLIAAILGAAIGFEREIHEHPAGMRTHLLVSLGSAIFTELSIFGFGVAAGGSGTVDPTRIAAQVVSGIGFLGAGAILKYGTSIRGLTTAASLWATAAIGMAVGAGSWIVAVVGAAIVIFSLWPLNIVIARLRPQGTRESRVRLHAGRLEVIGEVTRQLAARRIEIGEINTQRRGKGNYEIEIQLRLPLGVHQQDVVAQIAALPDVEILEMAGDEE
jgi:putative Mg2+ transporter-C (MgtC) family protein